MYMCEKLRKKRELDPCKSRRADELATILSCIAKNSTCSISPTKLFRKTLALFSQFVTKYATNDDLKRY